ALSCAAAATPAFGSDGTLWLVWSAGGRGMLAHSADRGAHFTPPVAVNRAAETIDDNGEARPRVAVLRDGALLVRWARRRDAAYTGAVMIARSTDGGASFDAPRLLVGTETSISQRFQILAELPDGRVLALWLDKRLVAEARTRGEERPGAALAAAFSSDG